MESFEDLDKVVIFMWKMVEFLYDFFEICQELLIVGLSDPSQGWCREFSLLVKDPKCSGVVEAQ